MTISSGSKICPSLNAQRGQRAEVEWLNFLNKILVENQSYTDASSFKPQFAWPLGHTGPACASQKQGAVQEGEPRASARQSELALQNSCLARQTEIPMHAQPWLPFCPACPPQTSSPASVPARLLLSLAWTWAAMGGPQILFLCYPIAKAHRECLLSLLIVVQISPIL